jgi:succinate dehydrogenase / fumarate reductase membrane anchor subunit
MTARAGPLDGMTHDESPAARSTGTVGRSGGLAWVLQAITGAVVLALVAVHMIVQHFVLPEGLRDYAAVTAWLASPVAVAVEVAFLGTVTWHALLGVRAVLLDLGPSTRVARLVTWILAVIGAATVLYGLWLTGVVIGAW